MVIEAKMNMIVEREMYIKEVEGERMMEHMQKLERRFSNEMSSVAIDLYF